MWCLKMPIQIDLSRLPELTNKVYYPLYWNQDRYLILYGGAGSGKSVFAAQKWIFRLLNEKGLKILVIRKVAKTLRHSVFALFRSIIAEWGLMDLFKINKSDMEIYCLNGSSVVFAGLDDAEKLKSVHGINSIWIEEASEITEDDFKQVDLRLRGLTKYYKQIILTFNPVSITHWLKTYFFDTPKENCTKLKTTYKDNRFIDEEYVKVIEELKDTDPYYYTVYGLGEWGIIGKTVYNARIVTERYLAIKDIIPVRGNFVYEYENEQIIDESIEFIEDENGFIAIYEPPIEYTPYVIGGDIAEGGYEFSAASVRNNLTWNQAATFRGHLDTDLYAKQMYCLGKYYNDALIGIETNFETHPVKELERLNYPNQYVRETLDKYTGETQKKFGWLTTKITRPLIIGRHVALLRDHSDTFNDAALLEEMMTFVRNEEGRPEHQEGKTDDLIFADAICLGIQNQQTVSELPGRPKPKLTPAQEFKEKLARRRMHDLMRRSLLG